MGLLDVVKTAAGVAFSAAGDFQKSVSYLSKATPSYNTSTGAVTAGTGQSTTTVDMIITQAKSNEINNTSVLANDSWALVFADAITVTPKEADEVTYDGVTYRVVAARKVIATGAVAWKLQLRTRK